MFSGLQFIGIVQGIVLYYILIKKKDKNLLASKILAYFNLLIAITLIGRLLISMDLSPYPFGYFADIIIFMYGPLIYFFVLSFLKKRLPEKGIFWHCIPAINHIFAVFVLTSQGQLKPYTEISFIDQLNTYSYGMYAETLAILLIQFYLILSFISIFTYLRNEKKEFSFKQFPKVFLILMGLIEIATLLWTTGHFSKFLGIYFKVSYDLTWLILPLITMVLTYTFMNQAEMFALKENIKSTVPDIQIKTVNELLLYSMENDKYFTNSKLTKTELAEKLNTNSTVLSKVINSIHKKNFFEFINEYRVKEFVKRATSEEYKRMTYLAIANDVGFHSKGTFYSSFKKIYGTTPKDYLSASNS